ncbi:hypothetical protein BH18ACI5_BH18ACI5_29800 [soil metagenome]
MVLPLLRDQMPKHLAEKVVDHLRLDTHAPVKEILAASLEAIRRLNERTDREKVEDALGAYRAGGLGVAGAEETIAALEKGQVEELLISASLNALQPVDPAAIKDLTGPNSTMLEPAVKTAAGGEAATADPNVVRLAANSLLAPGRQRRGSPSSRTRRCWRSSGESLRSFASGSRFRPRAADHAHRRHDGADPGEDR